MSRIKYTEDQLRESVEQSYSISETLRNLGYEKYGGGTASNIRKKIDKIGICTKHFRGSGWNKGGKAPNRKTTDEYLVLNNDMLRRLKRSTLKRCLLDIGRKYECECCGQGDTYNNLPLTIEIDHIDGNWFNNLRENLRFICPNCHTQTPTYGNKKRTI